jgi:TonB-linked SusC/RagA family outer membrane protein
MTTGAAADRSIGALARAHYGLLGRYILDAVFRVDGSSQFGQNNRYGSFPGVSAKWILSDETFMKKSSKWLSFLAIRPSWGVTGRQPGRNYLNYSRYTPDNVGYMGISGMYPSSIPLTNLRWEKVTATNLGADVELLRGKFAFTFDVYHKRTSDLLFLDLDIPSTSGFSKLTWKNVGVMDNNGYEIDVRTFQLIKSGKFTMDFNFNVSNQLNTIVEMDPLVLAKYNEPASIINNGVYLSRFQVNNSYGSIYGLRYKGVYQYSYENYKAGEKENAPVAKDINGQVMYDNNGTPKRMYYRYNSTKYAFQGGDAIYEDINHDGSIDEYDIVYLGNSNPKLSGGFGTTARYGLFSLNLFLNFRYGNKIVNFSRMDAENMFTDNNQTQTTNWRWRKEGDITDVPRAVYQQAYNWVGSDRYVEDGSFLRFKYLTLAYEIPSKSLKKFGMNQLNFSLTLNNLFCLTKYSGTDPEMGYDTYGVSREESKPPRTKSWTLGITATF